MIVYNLFKRLASRWAGWLPDGWLREDWAPGTTLTQEGPLTKDGRLQRGRSTKQGVFFPLRVLVSNNKYGNKQPVGNR